MKWTVWALFFLLALGGAAAARVGTTCATTAGDFVRDFHVRSDDALRLHDTTFGTLHRDAGGKHLTNGVGRGLAEIDANDLPYRIVAWCDHDLSDAALFPDAEQFGGRFHRSARTHPRPARDCDRLRRELTRAIIAGPPTAAVMTNTPPWANIES